MDTIWFKKDLNVSDFEHWGKNTLGEHLGMRFVAVGTNFLQASMPVDHRTHQPYGLLHGGASVALAETVGSVASALVVNHDKYYCVGMEINANHLRSVKSGIVVATATPLHLGRTSHVWDIKITDERNRLVCVSRLTVAVVKRDVAATS
ncbi:MAG TPA: esterase [Chitinophagaceae bacterium]|jgi:1,4-dihydroxy-2-naphthoyl-CoA hydrolase|nr:esterase [Chitinophagaceae bacterium]HAN40072.1 esterase [Chitinophagaceae bacterium]